MDKNSIRFKDLQLGQAFTFSGKEFIKVSNDGYISCPTCGHSRFVINAQGTTVFGRLIEKSFGLETPVQITIISKEV